MLDQVMTGSLCFLALAIYMYIKFIRRDRSAAFEQVRPHAKEAQSPPSRESASTADPFNVMHPHNNSPPPRKPLKGGHHVYQHPMRRRTHSSMTNVDVMGMATLAPLQSPTEIMSLAAVESPGPIPEDTVFFAKSPTLLHKGIPPTQAEKPASPIKKRPLPKPSSMHLSSPDINLFAEIPSDKDSLRHLESQRSPDGLALDVILNMPSSSGGGHPPSTVAMPVPPPPPLPPMVPPPPRAKLLLDDRNQPAQMQLDVARKAHIPLFLHLPLHPPRKDDGGVQSPNHSPHPVQVPIDGAAAVVAPVGHGSHAIKRPSRSNSFNFRIDFHELAMGELIGQGAFGTVHKATWRGTLVAVKILQVQHLSPDVLDEFETEVHIMSVLRHPNICLLMGACLDPPTRCLVVEYLPNGSLWCVLRQPSSVNIDLKKQLSFAMDTALGMHYLHTFDPPILHRDLKSPNLLVDGSYRLKISDFGLARVKAHHQTMTGNCGTTQWMAPEVLAAEKYTEKADVFSFGVVCWETVTRACPYDGLSQIQAALGVLNHNLRPTIPPTCPPFLKKLMTVCWGPVPEKRPTFAQIIDMLNSSTNRSSTAIGHTS
ncbi:TKL protein kinase, variant 1 [Aphanomyces invadans]|uniref:non-specific serine/threonine protein kinase n=1 Tax=Aphanomyces invadans TaxID=157072 RepID=A0A024TYM5_9STRA|nr:TKL protein kinase, variant 1 [Aphanomyces invadans]ETV99099.1 TKL protein kinase, variant 1 [Aphanomyces invadans]|eukprot:XP_008872526.1 TKL protein kinase, variant 1 [Aphanomyces invadans]